MLCVDKSRHTATLLHLSDGVQGEGGFTGTLRAVNLNDAAYPTLPYLTLLYLTSTLP